MIMRKSTSILLGVVFMAVALCLFATDNMVCAVVGTAFLLAAVILIRYAEATQYTQDEKRGSSNRNLDTGGCNPPSHR